MRERSAIAVYRIAMAAGMDRPRRLGKLHQ
jgi:hypothetical protein